MPGLSASAYKATLAAERLDQPRRLAVGCIRLILIEAPSSAYRRGTAGVGHTTFRSGGDLMRFYTKPHKFYCGIDLHARTMKAMHGGQAKHDKIDAQKIAVLLRGGM